MFLRSFRGDFTNAQFLKVVFLSSSKEAMDLLHTKKSLLKKVTELSVYDFVIFGNYCGLLGLNCSPIESNLRYRKLLKFACIHAFYLLALCWMDSHQGSPPTLRSSKGFLPLQISFLKKW